jgi:cytochrome c oxidase subunit IV
MTTAHSRIPDEPHDVSRPHAEHKVPYLMIFGVLVVLTVVTVAVALIEIRSELAKVLIALLIASIKAGVVLGYFMHLKFEGKLIYLITIVPVILSILLVCSLIPDVVYTLPNTGSTSMHVFNDMVGLFYGPRGDAAGH